MATDAETQAALAELMERYKARRRAEREEVIRGVEERLAPAPPYSGGQAAEFRPNLAGYRNPDINLEKAVRINTIQGPLFGEGAVRYTEDRDRAVRDWQAGTNIRQAPREEKVQVLKDRLKKILGE